MTTVPTMVLAEGGMPSLGLVLATLAGGTLAAGSANALNCYYDRDIDQVMHRTARRPLARRTVPPRNALVFGLVLGVLATALLAVTTNLLAAALGVAAIAFYVVVYTMLLKRRTSQNIVWGGAAGCMPVLIGWAAVTGSLSWVPWALFAVIFFWTPPHYWPLAMRYRDDYAAAGVPMLPVVAEPRVVSVRIVAYSWAMVAASLLLVAGPSGALYAVAAVAARRGVPRRGPPPARPHGGRHRPLADAPVPLVHHLPGAAVPRRGGRPARLSVHAAVTGLG